MVRTHVPGYHHHQHKTMGSVGAIQMREPHPKVDHLDPAPVLSPATRRRLSARAERGSMIPHQPEHDPYEAPMEKHTISVTTINPPKRSARPVCDPTRYFQVWQPQQSGAAMLLMPLTQMTDIPQSNHYSIDEDIIAIWIHGNLLL